MRIGIVILPELRWTAAKERWRRAEEYGFAHAWTYDHLGWRDLVDGPWFDAVPTLAAAATVTSTIRLGTYVATPNFRHPVHFAREVTALDDIADGRLILGLGAGSPSFDAKVIGSPELSPGQRVERFGEFTELLDLILRQDRTTWQGNYYTAVDARGTPGCLQMPRVPFLMAAGGPRSMRLAVRYAAGWVTLGSAADTLDAWWRGVAEHAQHFSATVAEHGDPAAHYDRYLSLDAAPVYSLSSLACFEDAVGRAGELGFTDAICHWPRPSSWYTGDESVLDQVAAEMLGR